MKRFSSPWISLKKVAPPSLIETTKDTYNIFLGEAVITSLTRKIPFSLAADGTLQIPINQFASADMLIKAIQDNEIEIGNGQHLTIENGKVVISKFANDYRQYVDSPYGQGGFANSHSNPNSNPM